MTPDSLTLHCTGPELIYLCRLVGGETLLGIEDPFPGWLTEEIQASMEQARQNLEARGTIQVDAANRIHMDAKVTTLLNAVTFPRAVFVYTLTLPGAQPVRQVFYWKAPVAVRLLSTEEAYDLELLANPEAIYQEITRGWSAETQDPPPGEAVALPVPVLESVRHFLAQEALDDACSALRGAGATETTISALIETLRTLRRNGAIVALRPQKQNWYPAGLGLLEGKNGLWGLRSFERYGQMWVEFSPIAASTLPEALCCFMGRFATFDRNPVWAGANMTKAIVTVKRVEEARVRDLELPVDVPVVQLAEIVAKALGWDLDATGYPVSYNIEAHPPGRLLDPGETLAQAGVWDGSWLVFHPRGAIHASAPVPAVQSVPAVAPQPSPQPTPSVAPADPPPASSGFVWKQIDGD